VWRGRLVACRFVGCGKLFWSIFLHFCVQEQELGHWGLLQGVQQRTAINFGVPATILAWPIGRSCNCKRLRLAVAGEDEKWQFVLCTLAAIDAGWRQKCTIYV
jgi:hypothetical protein